MFETDGDHVNDDSVSETMLANLGLNPISTWGTSRNMSEDGEAPTAIGDDAKSESQVLAASQCNLPRKVMKAASKALQFYTTIVVICCAKVKEWRGFVKTCERSCHIFKMVECALRDRATYPLPANVSSKDLLDNSFFKGTEEDFRMYCEDCKVPLTEDMKDFAERLFANKFSDTLKIIRNHVLPRFLQIMKELTGKDGKKSG